jgi:hypothetical protein
MNILAIGAHPDDIELFCIAKSNSDIKRELLQGKQHNIGAKAQFTYIDGF